MPAAGCLPTSAASSQHAAEAELVSCLPWCPRLDSIEEYNFLSLSFLRKIKVDFFSSLWCVRGVGAKSTGTSWTEKNKQYSSIGNFFFELAASGIGGRWEPEKLKKSGGISRAGCR
jgi:hypothetical protein